MLVDADQCSNYTGGVSPTTMTTTPTVPVPFEVIHVTEKIPVGSWEQVIRRLEGSAAVGSLSLLTVSILIDGDGRPILWTQPACRRFEPHNSAQVIREMVAEGNK